MSRWFALEGIDGCGKSVQARLLVAALQQEGHAVHHLREPGSTPLGEALRTLLLAPSTGALSPFSEALLFSAARAEYVRQAVAPALAAGGVVVAERSYLSTFVYQGAAAGTAAVPAELLAQITAAVHGDCWPDRIFLLDVPDEVAAARRSQRRQDRFEQDGARLRAVARAFREVAAQDPRVELVPATGTVEQVHQRLRALVAARLEVPRG